METLQAEQALFLVQSTLPMLEKEHQTTLRIFEAIPADKSDYRPDPVAPSARELAWHIAAAENRFLNGIAAGEFDFTSPTRPATMGEVITWFADTFADNLTRLKAMSGEQAAKVIDFHGVLQMPAAGYLNLANNHSIHHRGQLTVYLRPMGAKVPAIYGESYDSKQTRLAAEAVHA